MNIHWHKPTPHKSEATPPFGRVFLACFAGMTSSDAGKTYKPYFHFQSVKMLRRSNNDQDEFGESFLEWQEAEYTWDQFQFVLEDSGGNEIDWTSDAIIAWAKLPNMAEYLPTQEAA